MTTNNVEGHELAKFGFIHVTGLMITDPSGGNSNRIEAAIKALGSWGRNHGYTVAVTPQGKVWITYGDLNHLTEEEKMARENTLQALCPQGDSGGEAAFCAINGGWEQINMRFLLKRLNDPAWEPRS